MSTTGGKPSGIDIFAEIKDKPGNDGGKENDSLKVKYELQVCPKNLKLGKAVEVHAQVLGFSFTFLKRLCRKHSKKLLKNFFFSMLLTLRRFFSGRSKAFDKSTPVGK